MRWILLLVVLCLGYYLYQGPLAPLLVSGEFPMETLKRYEDALIDFQGNQGYPRGGLPKSLPARTGRMVVLASQMQLQPRLLTEFFEVPEELRARKPGEVQTVVFFLYVPSDGIKEEQSLYWMSFDWPSKRCLGYQKLKSWPKTYTKSDVRKDYPNLVELLARMPVTAGSVIPGSPQPPLP